MNILALDTATPIISAALSFPGGKGYLEFDAGPRHSEILMDMVDTLMKSASLEPGDLDLAACMRGPGSFTGLRIGFSAVKGLALALGIPVVSVPTLDCIAAACFPWPGLVVPLIDAKQGRFFTALYHEGRRISPYLDADCADIAGRIAAASAAPVLLTGPDAPLLEKRLEGLVDNACRKGKAGELLEIAQGYYERGEVDLPSTGPLYLRKSDAEINREGRVTRVE